MHKSDYSTEIEAMINEGIKNRTYTETDDTLMQDLKWFQDFLCQNF